MSGGQLPAAIGEFADFLRVLTGRLDPGAGWYGVFARRDPGGLEACLAGQEVPPWDVVQALLQDLSARHGPEAAREAAARAAVLYRASVLVHDTEVGGRAALQDRLEAMLGEQRRAARRERRLQEAVHTAGDTTTRDGLAADLAWAHDDWERATARCEELRARLAALPPTGPGPRGPVRPGPDRPGPDRPGPDRPGPDRPGPDRPGPGRPVAPEEPPPGTAESVAATPAAPESSAERPAPAASAPPPTRSARSAPARNRPRGARFAGIEPDAEGAAAGGAAEPLPPAAAPVPAPVADAAPEAPATPRGARFAGAYGAGDAPRRRRRGDREESATHRAVREAARRGEAHRAAAEAVTRLGSLRAQGRGGEAHVVLCEAAAWPAPRLPVLAAELERAGLGADVATLLWEMACLPPPRLAAAAEALMAAGREADGERLLRQSVSRPVVEIAHTALALVAAGADHEAGLLLRALVRARSPEDAADAAGADPATLVPLLLDAADGVSTSSHHDLALALRVAGLA
ncbi:hypothetical protein HUT19_09325 [Streptomyces sp. NA02950]|uniref:hypothetical protein n=1 Tax=Streptomyces sp. NA02950 TaxID=2742137 RepID=UPI001591B038|nr:hypothetical protein [Streptomyces sp. NA02950]QKV91919.1 hypothetical protein HUT19_09325 [Streptomyces sp. NA02950]